VRIDVIANDAGHTAALDPSSLTIVSAPADGRAHVIGTGEILYRPSGSLSGVVTFLYRVCDTAGACSTARVTVDVT